MNRLVREEELPGIGRRYNVEVDYGAVLTIIVHNSGRRDLYFFPPDSEVPPKTRAASATITARAGLFWMDLTRMSPSVSPPRRGGCGGCGARPAGLPNGSGGPAGVM